MYFYRIVHNTVFKVEMKSEIHAKGIHYTVTAQQAYKFSAIFLSPLPSFLISLIRSFVFIFLSSFSLSFHLFLPVSFYFYFFPYFFLQ